MRLVSVILILASVLVVHKSTARADGFSPQLEELGEIKDMLLGWQDEYAGLASSKGASTDGKKKGQVQGWIKDALGGKVTKSVDPTFHLIKPVGGQTTEETELNRLLGLFKPAGAGSTTSGAAKKKTQGPAPPPKLAQKQKSSAATKKGAPPTATDNKKNNQPADDQGLLETHSTVRRKGGKKTSPTTHPTNQNKPDTNGQKPTPPAKLTQKQKAKPTTATGTTGGAGGGALSVESFKSAFAVLNPYLWNLFFFHREHMQAIDDAVHKAAHLFCDGAWQLSKNAAMGTAIMKEADTFLTPLFAKPGDKLACNSQTLVTLMHGTSCAKAEEIVRTGFFEDGSEKLSSKATRGVPFTSRPDLSKHECFILSLVNVGHNLAPHLFNPKGDISELPKSASAGYNLIGADGEPVTDATKAGTAISDLLVLNQQGEVTPLALPLFVLRASDSAPDIFVKPTPPKPAPKVPLDKPLYREQPVLGEDPSFHWTHTHMGIFASLVRSFRKSIASGPVKKALKGMKAYISALAADNPELKKEKWKRNGHLYTRPFSPGQSLPLGAPNGKPATKKASFEDLITNGILKANSYPADRTLYPEPKVTLNYNPSLNSYFLANLALMNNVLPSSFTKQPDWKSKPDKTDRELVMKDFYRLAMKSSVNSDFRVPKEPYEVSTSPEGACPLMSLVQGTSEASANAISASGFFTLAMIDEGYYAKGVYFSGDFKYSYVYGQNTDVPSMIYTLVAPGPNVYPTTDDHMGKDSLMGKIVPPGYTSTFVVVNKQGGIADFKKDDERLYTEMALPARGHFAAGALPVVVVHPDKNTIPKDNPDELGDFTVGDLKTWKDNEASPLPSVKSKKTTMQKIKAGVKKTCVGKKCNKQTFLELAQHLGHAHNQLRLDGPLRSNDGGKAGLVPGIRAGDFGSLLEVETGLQTGVFSELQRRIAQCCATNALLRRQEALVMRDAMPMEDEDWYTTE